jgi:hypothetical protein
MQKPLTISIGIFLFLFGLAYAKASKPEIEKNRISPSALGSVTRAE